MRELRGGWQRRKEGEALLQSSSRRLTIIFRFEAGYNAGRDLSGFAAKKNRKGFDLGHIRLKVGSGLVEW